MKKIFLLSLFSLLLSFSSSAQFSNAIEIKSFPYAAFLPQVPIFPLSVEAIFNDKFGVEADAILASFDDEHVRIFYLSAKYYFVPRRGGDSFYFGAYGGIINADEDIITGLGGLLGEKFLFRNNWMLDLAIGLGLSPNTVEFFPYIKCSMGYRFNMVKKEK